MRPNLFSRWPRATGFAASLLVVPEFLVIHTLISVTAAILAMSDGPGPGAVYWTAVRLVSLGFTGVVGWWQVRKLIPAGENRRFTLFWSGIWLASMGVNLEWIENQLR